jgi:hypothetical protein
MTMIAGLCGGFCEIVVALGFVTNISPTTIHKLLKKTDVISASKSKGVSPRSEGRGVAAIEDVLEVTEQRTSAETTLRSCGFLFDEVYPHAAYILRGRRTSLHTHTPASLYETFPLG